MDMLNKILAQVGLDVLGSSAAMVLIGGVAALFALAILVLRFVVPADDSGDVPRELAMQMASARGEGEKARLMRSQQIDRIQQVMDKQRFDVFFVIVLLTGLWMAIAMLYFTVGDRDSLLTLGLTSLVVVGLTAFKVSQTRQATSALDEVRSWLQEKEGETVEDKGEVDGGTADTSFAATLMPESSAAVGGEGSGELPPGFMPTAPSGPSHPDDDLRPYRR